MEDLYTRVRTREELAELKANHGKRLDVKGESGLLDVELFGDLNDAELGYYARVQYLDKAAAPASDACQKIVNELEWQTEAIDGMI